MVKKKKKKNHSIVIGLERSNSVERCGPKV